MGGFTTRTASELAVARNELKSIVVMIDVSSRCHSLRYCVINDRTSFPSLEAMGGFRDILLRSVALVNSPVNQSILCK